MKRILSAIIFAGILVGTLLLRDVSLGFFDAFIGVVLILASLEVSNALTKMNKINNKYTAMIYPSVLYLVLIWGIKAQWGLVKLILIELLFMFVTLLITFLIMIIIKMVNNYKLQKKKRIKTALLNKGEFKNCLLNVLHTAIICFYPCWLLALLLVFNHFTEFAFIEKASFLNTNISILIISLVFGLTFTTDIFAQAVGTAFKGPKLVPLISPNKTISGAIGGLVFTLFSSSIIYFIFANGSAQELFFDNDITIVSFLIIGFCSSIFSQIGDIVASAIKRKAGIKDFGNIMPGHGGIMDRFDGISFNTFVILLFTIIFFI